MFLTSNFSRVQFDPDEHHRAQHSWLSKWTYEHDYPVRQHSWEKVAIDEMINARIRMAMWAFEQAERFEKSQPKIEYYTMSYNFT